MNNKVTSGQLIFAAAFNLFWPVLLLFLSGDWLWPEGWIFSAWYILMAAIIMIYLYLRDPELLAERFRKGGTGNQKKWDVYFLFGIGITFLAWMILMPLDAKRFNWSRNFPFFLKPTGVALLLLSFFFLFRSFSDNTFLSPLVRIQSERKQHLVTTGVYSFVRHPMYLGALLMLLGTPLLLGSYYGIGLGLIMSLLIAIRTLGEEKMLIQEFEDYHEYRKKVKYRFIPFVW